MWLTQQTVSKLFDYQVQVTLFVRLIIRIINTWCENDIVTYSKFCQDVGSSANSDPNDAFKSEKMQTKHWKRGGQLKTHFELNYVVSVCH